MNTYRAAHTRLFLFLLLAMVGASGCRSRVINVTIENRSGAELRNVEVQYPGGSYGRSAIPAGSTYSYRIKVLRSGALLFSYTDAAGKTVTTTGPAVTPQLEGDLVIDVASGGVAFAPRWQP